MGPCVMLSGTHSGFLVSTCGSFFTGEVSCVDVRETRCPGEHGNEETSFQLPTTTIVVSSA